VRWLLHPVHPAIVHRGRQPPPGVPLQGPLRLARSVRW